MANATNNCPPAPRLLNGGYHLHVHVGMESKPLLRRLHDWAMSLASHRHAMVALFAVSFAESSFFPIPPDVLVIPMVLAAREKAWRIAMVCTVGSVLGGCAGYGIGALLFEVIGNPVLEFYGYAHKFGQFQSLYNEWGAWIVFSAGLSPIPYKVFTIASGATDLNLMVFTIASILSRGLRFFVVAALFWKFGTSIRSFIEIHLGLLTIAFCIMLLGGFVAMKFLF
jgi:membrane protein YqaA with SNARE-associated domain